MKKWRLWLGGAAVVAALSVATVWPTLASPAQAQTPPAQTTQGWTCPFLGGEQAQAMNEAMQNQDYERMQELMGNNVGQMMPGVDAEAMRNQMQNVDFSKMQQLMGNGDWQGMLDYMREQGMGDMSAMMGSNGAGMMGPNGTMPNGQSEPRQTPAAGSPTYGPGAMMGGAQPGSMMGAQGGTAGPQGGMMGGGGMMGRR
ncbi:MAG: hypothetical protein ACYC4L_20030 [Chloroflexota bacterium]